MAVASSSFSLLDDRIQRFLWQEGWESLRDAQEAAIPPILAGESDVLIAAPTAAGKTEAAFLPALTRLLAEAIPSLILYVSPLKALINDQFGRLGRLCEQLEVPVHPWHGDIAASRKERFRKAPHGVLLITPESLEAILCRRGSTVPNLFAGLAYTVVDELHAFIGTERGKQLQSLLHRIELAIDRTVPRIALSATLGDMSLAARFLRPGAGLRLALIESTTTGAGMKILVKGYIEPSRPTLASACAQADPATDEPKSICPNAVAGHLFQTARGSSNLVFPNSRREVERYTHLLRNLCERAKVPNEFWPHHGSLAAEIRHDTEAALKQRERPATAICTTTLELGIDIGAVRSVIQIGPPPSVASLRQRLGRSGRRPGEAAILVGYAIEPELDQRSSIEAQLRLGLVRQVASISLLLERWFEPPRAHGVHFSTLIQQLLSSIAQRGGARIGDLYRELCGTKAPFSDISPQDFTSLVRHLGEKQILMQECGGSLLHAPEGERLVQHRDFYTAFVSNEEYSILTQGRSLGTVPITQMLRINQRILFAGRTWKIEEVDEVKRRILVSPAPGGSPPLFDGGTGRVHTMLRQRMREILAGNEVPAYLDGQAQELLAEGRACYRVRGLARRLLLRQGGNVLLLTWRGDATNEALACLLRHQELDADAVRLGVEVRLADQPPTIIRHALRTAAQRDLPPLDQLLADIANLRQEKWDGLLPDSLLRRSYASMNLDLDEARSWLRRFHCRGSASKTPVNDGPSV